MTKTPTCERCNDTGWLDCSSYPESGCAQEGHGGPCTCPANARYLPPSMLAEKATEPSS